MTEKTTYSKTVANRIARTIGHTAAIKRMLEEGREYYDVLVQISAVKAELESMSKLIIKEQLRTEIESAVNENDEQSIERLTASIDKLL